MRGAFAPVVLIVVAGLALSACASGPAKPKPTARAARTHHDKPVPKPTPRVAERLRVDRPSVETPPPLVLPPPRQANNSPISSLPGWAQEDHLAALTAFQIGCSAARDAPSRALCGYARSIRAPDDAAARVFFEENFRAEPVPETPGTAGVLTAYFSPEYEARTQADGEFSAPVRPRPRGSVAVVAASPPFVDPDDAIGAVLAEAQPDPQPTTRIDLSGAERSVIERSAGDGALAWMRPEDLFFLQIQGSGTLTFPDGRRLKAAYAADNGKPFVAIARPMVNRGLLGNSGASGENIRSWLASHRGPEADRVMWLNPRYVFFSLARDDDREPAGAAGIPLPAGRSIAIDPSRHAYGEVFWIDAEAPVLAGAAKVYHRLAMALDTGNAIRGQVRADLYIGRGVAAGVEAGRVRHTLRMTRLVPADPDQRGSARRETSASTGGG